MNHIQTYNCTVSGTVKTYNGTAISGAEIMSLPFVGAAGDIIQATSDLGGNYSWSGLLVKGNYNIQVSKEGYETTVDKITVTDNLIQKITKNFQLLTSIPVVGSCTLLCNSPSKTTNLLLTTYPSSPIAEVKMLGQCTKGVTFRYTLNFDDTFKEGVKVQVYDMDQSGQIYTTFTITNGKTFSFLL